MAVRAVQTRLLRVPPAVRGRVPLGDGAPKPTDVVLVDVETDGGLSGVGWTVSPGGAGAALASLVERDIAPLLIGEDELSSEKCWAKFQQAFRRLGSTGLPARAYAALDLALWDLKGKRANLPVWKLIGAARPDCAAFVSSRDARAGSKQAADLKAIGLRLELGACDPEADVAAVGEARAALGDGAFLAAAANERYDLGTAMAMGRAFDNEFALDWFDAPVPMEDVRAYRRLASKLDLTLTVGERFETPSAARPWLRTPLARVLRPDPFRLGGLTPWLRLAAMADGSPVLLSPACGPELGVQLGCGLQVVQAVEWNESLAPLWASGPAWARGRLVPADAPGLGVTAGDAGRFGVG